MTSELQLMAIEAARVEKIDVALVLAVIETESSWRTAAWKPEPPYRYLWDVRKDKPFRPLTPAECTSESPPDDFPGWPGAPRTAEWTGQQASWGLMQVMGGVAREHGFRGQFHTELCVDPRQGLAAGCRYLAVCLKRWGAVERAVAAYNAGTPRRLAAGGFENQEYVDKVLRSRDSLASAAPA